MGPLANTGYSGPRSRQRYSARSFVLIVAVVFGLALVAWLGEHTGLLDTPIAKAASSKRDFIIADEECRLVHKAADKCAFVQANCPDEEAGIFSYLTLYYCRLPHVQPVAFTILVLWLGLLFSTIGIAASDFFCVNLSTISSLLGMSESMAGVTFLALGNGSPDVFSTFAAMSTNSASLAIGELIGAAGFITAVVAGSMALVRPFKVARKSFVRDVGFFIVAASFSMVFLWDGKLSLWESATMVGFYVFYVCFVMVWHWWLGRRTAHRRRAATMRSQYVVPGGEAEELPQEYHDDDDEDGAATSATTHSPIRGISVDDFDALERAGGSSSLEEDENEEMRERWLGELSNNMRLSRPPMGSRRNTLRPIRPSLVGALEFRAVLTSLQKSRNIQSMPINLRRYSDDPTYTSAQQQGIISTISDPAPRPPYQVPPEDSEISTGVSRLHAQLQAPAAYRTRAVSTNDIGIARVDPTTWPTAVPSIDVNLAIPEESQDVLSPINLGPPSPSFSLSPPPSEPGSRAASPGPQQHRPGSPDRLAPPVPDVGHFQLGTPNLSPRLAPVLEPSPGRDARPRPKLVVPGPSSPPIPFPAYTDYPFSAGSSRPPSLRLPSPSVSTASLYHVDPFSARDGHARIPKWWPFQVLPPPDVLLSTLFPTLSNWKTKNVWEKLLGVVASPSVFLLTITLPVVEPPGDENLDEEKSPSHSLSGPLDSFSSNVNTHPRSVITITEPDGPSEPVVPASHTEGSLLVPDAHSKARGNRPRHTLVTNEDMLSQSPEQIPADACKSEPKPWNRWLVIVQTFTAPLFIVLIVWANTEIESPRVLFRYTLYSLIFSLVCLAIIVTTTTPSRPPRWRAVLCFFGFAVSIAWISSIANEVVGVLKTLGVILNMSDAILGLTIFAVGNSLGDFVADITVARLGFPVMALSACFGGPMLNILLGIGISGCYITIKGGRKRHRKHPNQPIKFKPYHIDVSTTLVISGATLLITLVGLLVAVPLRGWKMDRKIGWGLVALWSLSTLANVIVEVTGFSSNVS